MHKKILMSALFLFVLWFSGFLYFNHKIHNYKLDNTTKTDAIIALTGGKNRIAEAVNLLNKGLAEKLFISGVQKDISLEEIQKASVDTNIKGEVTIEDKSLNTVENAIETNKWINENNIKSIRLVTSNYHIFRSLEEFNIRNPELVIIVHPVYSENVSKEIWKNFGSLNLLVSEYNKFLYVFTRNRFQKMFKDKK